MSSHILSLSLSHHASSHGTQKSPTSPTSQVVLDNPTNFRNPFQFEITFECLQELEDGECRGMGRLSLLFVRLIHTCSSCLLNLTPTTIMFNLAYQSPNLSDLEWKVVYVGSAEDMTRDQVLDEILVGPVPVGVNKFVLQADAPDPASIPNGDILGVTVVLVTCSYKDREFIRIGYYVNNEYAELYDPVVGPPSPLDITKVVRTILADKPRVTRFNIPWDGAEEKGPPPQQEAAEGDVSMELADDDDGLAEDYEEEEEDEDGGDDDGEIDLEMLPNE